MRLAPQQSWKHEAVASPPWEEMTRDETKKSNIEIKEHIFARRWWPWWRRRPGSPRVAGATWVGAEGFGWGGGGGSGRRR
ncbi:hypothetical protein GUJ93_ZPchr0001g29950 [Zizania palustris]|uniref:Uncharacterized protein n=1 Tax=Zizania palustris TaxID=103762 RepID=A0A8J5RMA3_ZIZPA|nr:hypothetical protein GUJ93_ZPchr0001g29950 [Zizania palustris]